MLHKPQHTELLDGILEIAMIKSVILLTTIIFSFSSFGQNWEKILRHELIEGLSSPSDSIYIKDRLQLEKVSGYNCSDNILTFNYNTSLGYRIEIQIEKGQFIPSDHKVELTKTVYKFMNNQKRVDYIEVKNLIDDRYSYGIDGDMPKTEIKSLTIKWNGNNLTIPDTAYSNLYEPLLCTDHLKVESYLTTDNSNLFIYMYGSDGAGGYSVKFVFDKNSYVTRIVGTNEMTNGFDFLDGKAKVDN